MNEYIVGKAIHTWKDSANNIAVFPVLDPPGEYYGILVKLSKVYDNLGIFCGDIKCTIYGRHDLLRHYSDHRADKLLYSGQRNYSQPKIRMPAPSKFLKLANCYFPRSRR